MAACGRVLAVVALTALTASSCGTASGTAGHDPSSPGLSATSCALRGPDVLTVSDISGYDGFVGFSSVALPIRSRATQPLWFQRQYVCGKYYGFIARAAVTGPYRRQNNARAKAVHYPIGKWPYVPLTGGIVRNLGHRVLEIYEGVYQFQSAAAAKAYLAVIRGGSPPDVVSAATIPPGFVALATVLGPDSKADEHVIRISGRIGSFDVVASLQGGRSMLWSDAGPYWQKIWGLLQRIRDLKFER